MTYRLVAPDTLDVFHALVTDPHVRRFLMDGQVMLRDWSAERIADSAALVERCGLGLWLAHLRGTLECAGFCGFLELAGPTTGPQLVFALLERHTGCGLAGEMARTCIVHARAVGHRDIRAGVDAVNTASVRVLERLGFVREARADGAFGDLWMYRLPSAVEVGPS